MTRKTIWRAVLRRKETAFAASAWAKRVANRLGLEQSDEEGSTIAEMALVLPVLLVVLTGIFSYGIVLNQYLVLTNATNGGARAFALSRGSGTSSTATNADPCSYTATIIANSAPNLNTSSINYTIVYTVASSSTSTTYTGTGASAPSCASLVMNSGDIVSVKAVYSVNAVTYGLSKSLSLTAQSAELVQ
jgi:Flp pilus assembly protein TadG